MRILCKLNFVVATSRTESIILWAAVSVREYRIRGRACSYVRYVSCANRRCSECVMREGIEAWMEKKYRKMRWWNVDNENDYDDFVLICRVCIGFFRLSVMCVFSHV